MRAVFHDVRLTLRLLAKAPFWTAMVALTAALGIGATAAIFSIVNAVLMRPLPFPQPNQLYTVVELLGRVKQEVAVAGDYFTMRENTRTFSDMAAFGGGSVNWTGIDRPEQLTAVPVTASFFPLFRVQPLQGRVFRNEEDLPGANRVVVLSYALWQRRFGGDPAIVGQTIRLDRNPTLVIGIMPRSFDFPKGTELWMPMMLNEAEQRQRMRMRIVNIVARAKPGVSEPRLAGEMARLTQIVENEYPRQYITIGFLQGMRVFAAPLHERLVGHVRPALLAFAGAVALMLLIVCFNVANLMLARATSRRREIAVRVALGAPRKRIVSQLIAESLLVSVLGGALGITLAALAVRGLNSLRPLALEGLPEVSMDGATIAFTLVLTLLTGLIFGLAPAFGSLGFSVHEALQSETRSVSGSRGLRRLRRARGRATGPFSDLIDRRGAACQELSRTAQCRPGFSPRECIDGTHQPGRRCLLHGTAAGRFLSATPR